ncbi:MAG TPA: GH3 auxin-responsive promoter family protein [Bacillota bacterium]|nr:GH3 auxin-responsive promoter family protein [Bacillota bacterium]
MKTIRFSEKLKKRTAAQVWDEYCGFLDLSMEDYMKIQHRLLKEQISLMESCELGKRLLAGKHPSTTEEFRREVPLTVYEDYADILLNKRADMLPAEPVVWLETTWESGSRPRKLAPYTREMLDVYRNNILAAMMLSTSRKKGSFTVRSGDRVLYGLAPLPYATGLFPPLIASEINLRFMPPLKEAAELSFSQQNKRGFSMGARYGIDQFFGMSSVIFTITRSFAEFSKSKSFRIRDIFRFSPRMLWKVLRAKYICDRDERPIQPKDIFDLKGFVCVGTDTQLFKDELESAWGRTPLEIHGGTEPACMATETWSRNGLVFFPDNAFYEFIPKAEMLRGEADPAYVPHTLTMDEVAANEEYEIVLTIFKGGAFMRYRPGDMYRCLRTKNEKDGLDLPQFEYIDRVPSIIDIAGFTRITEASIRKVLTMSRLAVGRWFALKEYDEGKRSFLHFYVEIDASTPESIYLTEKLIREHFSVYYCSYDHDYEDLKRLLGIDPLSVTMLPLGTIGSFEAQHGHCLRTINADAHDLAEFKRYLSENGIKVGGRL